MITQEQIEALKNNKEIFGLMSDELQTAMKDLETKRINAREQTILEVYIGSWIFAGTPQFCGNFAYRLRPNYQLKNKDEKTYSIGDRFKAPNGKKVILVYIGTSGCDNVALVHLESGGLWNMAFTTWNILRIKPGEISSSIGGLIRYWDFQKQIIIEN